MNLKIWQNYHLPEQKNTLDPGFIPNNTIGPYTQYFENTNIIDIYHNCKSEWKDADYVGLLSPRFYDKTLLTSQHIVEFLSEQDSLKPVYLLTPKGYMKSGSPVSSGGFGPVRELAQLIDKNKLLPFELYQYDHSDCINFCNFWIAKPEVFDDYVSNYLIPIVDFLDRSPEARPILAKEIKHRKHETGITYYPHSFLLEAPFPIYVHYNKIPFDYILTKGPPPKKTHTIRNTQWRKRPKK